MGRFSRENDVTRRRLLYCGAAGLACAPVLAGAQDMPAPADTDKIATVNDDVKRLTVKVMINGHGPYKFVVDTGADRSVLADDVAASLGLLRGSPVLVQGVVRSLPSQTVAIHHLAFGHAIKKNLRIPVLPRNLLRADGYLGLDAIDGHRVTFDFKNHALEIGERWGAFHHYFRNHQQTLIPVSGDAGHLRSTDCSVGGVPSTAFVDTGAAVSVGNSQLFAALQSLDPGVTQSGTIALTGVTGGTIDGGVTVVDNMQLKDLSFSVCTLAIADLQIFDIWGLANKPALLIGMNYLRQFARVSIDYGSKELGFDLARIDNPIIAMRG